MDTQMGLNCYTPDTEEETFLTKKSTELGELYNFQKLFLVCKLFSNEINI